MKTPENTEETWDLSQERVFYENLLARRFDFFLVIFSLVVAGAVTADTKGELVSVLIVGLVLSLLMGFAVYRIFTKVIMILRILHRTDGHPVKIMGIKTKEAKWPLSFPVNDIFGYIVPIFCNLVLFVGLLLAICNVWKP